MKTSMHTDFTRRYVLVSGYVQGVGFRYFVTKLAEHHVLTGWVRNLDNGDVDMEVQGLPENVEAFLQAVEQGNSFAEVHHMDVRRLDPIPEREFRPEYDW